MKKIILAYVPVLHHGYIEFLQRNKADELWILGKQFASEFKEIAKDIRKLEPELTFKAITALNLVPVVKIVEPKQLKNIDQVEIIMPYDDLSKKLAKKYLKDFHCQYVPVFLRWDKHRVLSEFKPEADVKISKTKFDQQMMKLALGEASKSIDWWRQVAGIIVKNNKVLLAAINQHLPTEYESYFSNDIRSLFSKGKYIELLVSVHAEANLIAAAAKRGIKLNGTDMYVTLFPCPVCAKQIAQAGIKRLFYLAGYSLTDGESILRSAGVELIKVDLPQSEVKKLEKQSELKSILKKYK